jgi:hypothetical protein
VQWVQFVPSAVLAFVLFPLIGLASYQIGLWQFVSVRTSGVLLFAGTFFLVVGHSFEPFQELHVGSQVGYSAAAWVYTGVLWALTVPLFVLTGSIFRMSRRLTLLRVDLEPVVRGWRAWPTDLWTHALRTLCLPSFLMALPQGRARPTLLFALAAVVSALHTGLLFSYLTQAPSVLGFIVRTALREESDAVTGRVFPTVGAAITAVSPMQLSGIAPSNIILALPFVFVLILFVVATWLSQKVAASLVRRAQRRAALGYQMVIRQDTRRPILFLRPFREDERLFEPPANSLIAKIWRLKDRKRTLDEIVLDAASPVGPVIALGAPGEEIAPLGAARLYADDAEWQNVVGSLASQSLAIIIYLEESGGILWELKHLVAGGHLTKTLCILNPRTSLATIQGAIEEARRSDNTALCDMLERVRATISSVGTSKVVVGFRCTDGVVAPIIAEDASDYTHWCMVNLMLLALT